MSAENEPERISQPSTTCRAVAIAKAEQPSTIPPYIDILETGSLQSLWPVLPPTAHSCIT